MEIKKIQNDLARKTHAKSVKGLTYLQICCREPAWGIPPMAKVMRKEARQNAKAWSGFRGSPWVFLNIYPPKPESACLIVLCFPLFWYSLEKVNSGLQLTVSCIWKECFSSNPFDGSLTCLTVGDFYNLWIVYSPPTVRGTKLKAS